VRHRRKPRCRGVGRPAADRMSARARLRIRGVVAGDAQAAATPMRFETGTRRRGELDVSSLSRREEEDRQRCVRVALMARPTSLGCHLVSASERLQVGPTLQRLSQSFCCGFR
jgi:hypothetical protein